MEIKNEFPPNYAAISERFGLDKLDTKTFKPIFAWGLFIYNPHNAFIGAELMAHEEVHSSRQNFNPERWWYSYLTDDNFRFVEELAAHVIEYKVLVQHHGKTRDQRRQLFHYVAARLCSPMYGYKPKLHYDRARHFLKLALKEAEKPAPTKTITMASPHQQGA
jgi:hypothetical protein